jgi:hypothetical protein
VKTALREKLSPLFLSLALLSTLLSLTLSGVDIGEDGRLFRDITLLFQGTLLHIVAIFYSINYLNKERRGGVFIFPLSSGVDRGVYLLSVNLSIIFIISTLSLSFLFFDLLTALFLEYTLSILFSLSLLTLSASLLSTILIALAQYVSPFKALIYTIAIFIVGNGLDELYFYAYKLEPDQTLQTVFEVSSIIFPNFYLFDSNEVVFKPVAHFTLEATIFFLIGYLSFRGRVLRVED